MTLSIHTGQPAIFGRFPAFFVQKGEVVHHMGGAITRLGRGDTVNYKHHGSFKVTRAADNHGRIEVTLPDGETCETTIPPCGILTIVNGCRQVESRVPEREFGFVCEDWAKEHWNLKECTIEFCTDGSYVLLDHSLNGHEIYVGRTRDEVRNWTNSL